MNENLKEELNSCNSLNEMWTELNEHYDLDKRLGTITKKVVVINFIRNLDSLLKATRTPEREHG